MQAYIYTIANHPAKFRTFGKTKTKIQISTTSKISKGNTSKYLTGRPMNTSGKLQVILAANSVQ